MSIFYISLGILAFLYSVNLVFPYYFPSSTYSDECCRQLAEAEALPPLVTLASCDPGAVMLLVRSARIPALSPYLAKAGGVAYFVAEIECFLKQSSVEDESDEVMIDGRRKKAAEEASAVPSDVLISEEKSDSQNETLCSNESARDTTLNVTASRDTAGCGTHVTALCHALRWHANAEWLVTHDKLRVLLQLLDSAELRPWRHQVSI